MEKEKIVREKIIKITDLGNTLYFKIRLFNAMEGLDFMDNVLSARTKGFMSIKPVLNELLKLCIPMDAETGTKPVMNNFALPEANVMFQNPLAIIELGLEIFQFQEVFTKDSVIFQNFYNTAKNLFNTKASESQTE